MVLAGAGSASRAASELTEDDYAQIFSQAVEDFSTGDSDEVRTDMVH
jgi:hypothetical protein